MENTCSLFELNDYVVLPTYLKALLFEWIIIKKPTDQLGHGSQLSVPSVTRAESSKIPIWESKGLSQNLWERACHNPLSSIKGPVHWWLIQVPTAWLILICLLCPCLFMDNELITLLSSCYEKGMDRRLRMDDKMDVPSPSPPQREKYSVHTHQKKHNLGKILVWAKDVLLVWVLP